MANEQGIVIKTGLGDGTVALIKTAPQSACEACSSRSQCNPGDGGGKEREVEAVNLVDAQAGDLIQITMNTQALLQATFLVYIFPIICLLAGSFIGHQIGIRMRLSPSMLSLLIGIVCFVAAMLLIRRQAGYMALKNKYQPKITRILGRGQSDAPTGCEYQTTRST